MKSHSLRSILPFEPLTEEDIRDYAYHLYVQSGCAPGRDLDHWLEAKACLSACIPKARSHARLHHHTEARKQPEAPAAKVVAA
jgi:hypothetical protein